MPNSESENPLQADTPEAAHYEIRVKGHLVPRWQDWFEGLTATVLSNDEIILAGPVPDQAALHGLIARIGDLNLELIQVTKCEHRREER